MTLFAFMDAVSKHLTATLPVSEIIWVRYVFFTIFGLAIAMRASGFDGLRTNAPVLQGARGLALVTEIALVTLAFRFLQLAEVHAVLAIAPLFVTALAVVFLKERVGLRRWCAVGVGFIGVLIVVRPGLAVFQSASLISLASAVCFSVYLVLTRFASSRDTLGTSTFYAGAVGFVVMSAIVPMHWVTPTLDEWLWLLLASAFGVGAHVSVIRALSLAEASTLQPFNYLLLVWAALIGFLAFGDVPDAATFLGGGIIVASGLYAWHRGRPQKPPQI